ncbi:TRAP transporter permease [Pelagibacterium halotolerans]|uniref:TRAP transporter 4TM/12TM fusion protein n=1 Tax=Pelagibacterium halotolerans (strain DSM 22347 / JCM 15775 / CGMCC 1.7692 / B2) TaxID=1082931 RepID=G4RBH7_PELHB|nr:TRAP transporter fused permease subunit [Pelagibacterium halotolerans]AEQ52653.1 TRAP transporter 4TM/12TM fusion protein [Pelagibacterium halotolerans B2]QJR17644.1 TRAP transporter fused permease subunit [Pelagibacterium halotolerans]SEA83856.1 TRAP transporter, 4TM/12TM fusion protein [Pelagibacterium halotolerans]
MQDTNRVLNRPYRLISEVFAISLPIAAVIYSLQVLPRFGIIIYKEQYLTLFIAICVALSFLLKPAVKSMTRNTPPWYDIVGAVLALLVGGYIFLNYDQIVRSLGLITTDKVIVSVIGIVLLLEAARRHVGWTMVSVGLLALAYAYFGHYLSGMFETRVIRWDRLVTYNYLGTGAIFGTPVEVAATIVASFVVFGQVLFLVGGGSAISDFAFALMGRRKGGPAKVAILSSALFGSLSGSASANVATTGMLTIPMMRRVGYSAKRAGAVEAVASTGGLVLPPVMAATGFLMAEFLAIPYSAVAIAAAVPAILFFFCIYLQVHLESVKTSVAGADIEELPDLRDAAQRMIPVIVPFAILLWTLFGWNWNPAASAFTASFATIVMSVVIPSMRRPLKAYIQTFVEAGNTVVFIAIMCAIAGIVVGCLGLTGLGSSLSQNLIAVSGGSIWLLLILSAIGCIVLGMGVPVTATYIILVILIGPAFTQLGVSTLGAHMFIFYYGTLSFLTPPVCLSVFVAASIARSAPMATAVEALKLAVVAYIVPFAFVLNPAFLLGGTPVENGAAVLSGLASVSLISAGLVGFLVQCVSLPVRLVLVVVGIASFFVSNLHPALALVPVLILGALYGQQKLMGGGTSRAILNG